MSLTSILRPLTQIFLAAACPLCQRPAAPVLCNGCYRQIMVCQWQDSTLPVFSWGKYSGALKQSLTLLKYGNQAELGIWLGYQLGQHWRIRGLHKTSYQPVVVPIPLHQQRLEERGYNQAALIAKGFCRVTRLPLLARGLVRIKATDAMHRLGNKERQANLTGAFQIGQELTRSSYKSKPILLIDDIYTTGTTYNTANSTLVQTGYSILGIATVARAVLSSPLDDLSTPCHVHQTLNLHPSL